MLVHVGKTQDCLVDYTFDLLLGEVIAPVFHKLVDVLFHVLKDEVKIIIHPDNLLQLHDVNVVQLSKGLDFSQSHAFFPRVELLFHFLDGHLFVAVLIGSLDNRSVGSISECFLNFVPVHCSL